MNVEWSIVIKNLVKKLFTQKKYFLLFSVLVFFLPLTFSTAFYEAFEFPKLFFVYFMAVIICGLFFVELFLYEFNFKLPGKLVSVFMVLLLVSSVLSIHPQTSFWGYYSRFNDSFFSYLAFFGLYFVGINKLKKNDLSALIELSVLSVIISSAYGIFQHFGLFSGAWPDNASVRVFSTFGQPNWFAQYLGMILPVSLYFLGKRKQVIWGVVYLIGYLSLWFTYSLSGFVAFLVGIGLFLFYLRSGKSKIDKGSRLIYGFLGLSVFLSILFPGIFLAKVKDFYSDVQKKAVVMVETVALDVFKPVFAQNRVISGEQESAVSQNLVSDPGSIRFGMWEGSLRLIFSSAKVFLMGTGPETFPYAFQKFRPQSVNFTSEWDYVLNKPHNYYLEIWAEQGIVSLVIFISLGFILFKTLPVYLRPSIAVFYFSNIFGWPVVATIFLWWLFLIIVSEKGHYV